MSAARRSLKDTIKDPSVTKRISAKKRREKSPVYKIALALVIGFAGGLGTARFLRF